LIVYYASKIFEGHISDDQGSVIDMILSSLVVEKTLVYTLFPQYLVLHQWIPVFLFMIFSIELPSELIYTIIVVFLGYILHIMYNFFVTKTIMYFVAKYYSNFLCCNNYVYPSCDM
jgi:hypothetical protein